jgi:hypothetical protein
MCRCRILPGLLCGDQQFFGLQLIIVSGVDVISQVDQSRCKSSSHHQALSRDHKPGT